MPLTHNDNRPVSPEKFYRTRNELAAQFGAVTLAPGTALGDWVHEGRRYEDESLKLVVDVDDTFDNRVFFANYKAVLRERFEQIEIYIISIAIEVV